MISRKQILSLYYITLYYRCKYDFYVDFNLKLVWKIEVKTSIFFQEWSSAATTYSPGQTSSGWRSAWSAACSTQRSPSPPRPRRSRDHRCRRRKTTQEIDIFCAICQQNCFFCLIVKMLIFLQPRFCDEKSCGSWLTDFAPCLSCPIFIIWIWMCTKFN